MIRQLSARERVLASIVGVAVFIFINAFVIDYFLKNQTRLRGELAKNTGALLAMKRQLAERPTWEQRDAWVQARQPQLAADDTAAVLLLDAVKEKARTRAVQIVAQSLRPPAYLADYTSISVDLETTSTWAALIGFLQDLQEPEKFVVLESTNLKIDGADATQMRCNFRIARWYAPKVKPR